MNDKINNIRGFSMTRGIYCYIDKKNDEIVYVGQDSSIDTNERHKDHFNPSRYDEQQINRVLQNNPDRYTYQVLNFDVGDKDTLNALEIQYIRQLKPMFNFTEGGDGSTGYKFTEEQKKKMSEKAKERWEDEEYRNKMNKIMKSEEYRKKMSEKSKERWKDEEYRKNISEKLRGENNPNWGISFSDERRRRIGEESKRRWKNEDYRKNISEKMSGKNHPQAKYSIWDIYCVHYHKGDMFKNNRNPNPCRCFIYKYKGYHLPIGSFHDFVTPQIINNLISDALNE